MLSNGALYLLQGLLLQKQDETLGRLLLNRYLK